MNITRTSMISGEKNTMNLDISSKQIQVYNSGVLLQDAFPNLSDEEREFYKTGITPEEWNKIFASDSEEDGDGD